MKNIVALLLVFSVVITASGQGSEVRSPGTFSGVRASEGIDVYLKKGVKESVKVETTGVPVSEVITEVSGSYLKIHMAGSNNGHNKKSRTVKVYVTYVNISKIQGSSGASIYSDGVIKSSDISIAANSGASVEVTIDAESLNVETSSAGDVVVEGKATSLVAETSSGGEIDAYKVVAETVNASASSGGEAKVSVSKSLIANASSGGNVRYRGNPTKTMTNASSGGSVKKSAASE